MPPEALPLEAGEVLDFEAEAVLHNGLAPDLAEKEGSNAAKAKHGEALAEAGWCKSAVRRAAFVGG